MSRNIANRTSSRANGTVSSVGTLVPAAISSVAFIIYPRDQPNEVPFNYTNILKVK